MIAKIVVLQNCALTFPVRTGSTAWRQRYNDRSLNSFYGLLGFKMEQHPRKQATTKRIHVEGNKNRQGFYLSVTKQW